MHCGIIMNMTAITIGKEEIMRKMGVVVLPVKEYERLLAKQVPEYFLTGKAARDLDKLVEEGLRDYATGKTTTASSIEEALTVRRTQKKSARRYGR